MLLHAQQQQQYSGSSAAQTVDVDARKSGEGGGMEQRKQMRLFIIYLARRRTAGRKTWAV